MKVSQAVQVTNEKLEHAGKAGHVLSDGSKAGTVVVKIDGEEEPVEFKTTDLRELG